MFTNINKTVSDLRKLLHNQNEFFYVIDFKDFSLKLYFEGYVYVFGNKTSIYLLIKFGRDIKAN